MAGQDTQPTDPSDEMLRRMMQQHHLGMQRRLILQQPAEKCPRCDSVDTRFAYFNNMKESQPRYFCKGCKRLWTKGGKLRDVPVRPARDSFLAAGLIMRPVTSQSFLVGSAGRSQFNGRPHPQAPPYNIQSQPNFVSNVLNPFTAGWQAPNQGLRQLQPSMDNNMGDNFFGGSSIE